MQRLCSGTLFLQQKNDREQTWERLQGGEIIFSKMKKHQPWLDTLHWGAGLLPSQLSY